MDTILFATKKPVENLSLHHEPLNGPFHNFWALQSGDRQILRTSVTSSDGCWSSKVVKGSGPY